jgi:hypothetical protein
MRLTRPAAVLAAAALTLSLTGCFANPLESVVEGVIEDQTGVDVDVDGSGGASSVSLPEGWPGLPVPDGTITSAIASDGTFVLTILSESPDSVEAVAEELLASGYTEISRADLGGLITLALSSPEWTVTLGWGIDPDTQETSITYGVSPANG